MDADFYAIVLKLIRFHYERNDVEFDKAAKELAEYFENQDLQALSDFIMIYMDRLSCVIPQ